MQFHSQIAYHSYVDVKVFNEHVLITFVTQFDLVDLNVPNNSTSKLLYYFGHDTIYVAESYLFQPHILTLFLQHALLNSVSVTQRTFSILSSAYFSYLNLLSLYCFKMVYK